MRVGVELCPSLVSMPVTGGLRLAKEAARGGLERGAVVRASDPRRCLTMCRPVQQGTSVKWRQRAWISTDVRFAWCVRGWPLGVVE